MSKGEKFHEDFITFIFVIIGGIAFAIIFHFVLSAAIDPTPEEVKIYKECKKLDNIKKIYNNLSLEQKDYIYYNCI